MNQFANIALSKSLSDRVFEPEIFKNRVKAKALADEAVDRAQKAVEIDRNSCQAPRVFGGCVWSHANVLQRKQRKS